MNTKISCWSLIKQKKFEEACKKADEDYEESNDEHHLRNKTAALFNLKRYQEVLELSTELIRITEGRSDGDYISAGIANWLLNKPNDAVEIWKAGLNTKYTDAAGGVEIPSLMYYASVKLKDYNIEKEAVKLLKRRVRSKVSINFPGSIAGYILGKINEEELLNSYMSFPNLRTRILCKSYFYIAVSYLKKGDKEAFYKNLQRCIENETYLEDEYFLAIEELDRRDK